MSKGEDIIAKILRNAKINFTQEKTFHDLKNGHYRYDFYIPDYKGRQVVIEFNGMQHYKFINSFFASQRQWLAALERDRRKISYCLANDIDLYLIPYWDLDQLKKVGDLFKKEYKAKDRWHNDEIRLRRFK